MLVKKYSTSIKFEEVVRKRFTFPVLCFAFILTLSLLGFLSTSSLHAQEAEQNNSLASNFSQNINKKSPMLLEANELVNNDKTKTITAKGNVEIYYSGHAIQADRVIYNRATKKIYAAGGVRIKQPDGTVMRAERVNLKDDFSEGFVNALFIIFPDETRIAANEAERRNGNETIFREAVFTPCKPCKDDPDKAPMWRIKGKKVVHDEKKKEIYYEDTTFDFMGLTLAYWPSFYHPDPTVKRKTGFLMPFPGYSENLGAMVRMNYFWAPAPNYDFTFSPLFTSNRGVMLSGVWRHRLLNGQYSIDVAGIYEANLDGDLFDDPDDQYSADRRYRGSLGSIGLFDLGSYWNFGWNILYESDDSFRRLYKLDGTRSYNRIQDAFLIGQNDRNYFGAHIYQFGGLVDDRTTRYSPKEYEAWGLPVLDYNYIFADPLLGGELSFDMHTHGLYRPEGEDSARFTTALNWRKELTDSIGQVYKPFFHVRGDVYGANDYTDPITGDEEDKDLNTRGVAATGLEYRFPFVAHYGNGSHVIEPIAQIIARTSSVDQENLPNEDARSLIYDDTLLFDIDKFSGYDRVETGIRANVGLQYVWQLYTGGSIRLMAGQSFHLSGDNAYEDSTDDTISHSGLETDNSDYVAGLYFAPTEYLTILSQTRFDDDEFDLLRHDASARFKYEKWYAAVSYAFVEEVPDINLDRQHQIRGDASIPLNDYWSVQLGMRYDFELEDRLSNYVGLTYRDDCFSLGVRYNENYTGQDNVDVDRSVMVKLWLKHLGNFGTNTNSLARN